MGMRSKALISGTSRLVLLEDLHPKPGLHFPISSTEQISVGGHHAVDRPIMGLEGHYGFLSSLAWELKAADKLKMAICP